MKAKKKPLSDEKIFEACFDLIAEKGLGKARLTSLAKNVKIPLSELYARHPSIESVLLHFCDHVDRTMLASAAHSDSANKREFYFDMIMARIDVLQAYRPGTVRWLKDLTKHPDLWLSTLCRFEKSMALMLDTAQDSPRFPVKKIGITGIYLVTLKAWLEDESADMAKTMAALDKALGRGEAIIQRYMTKPKAA